MNFEIAGMTLYYFSFYFIIFSFAGWLMETVRVSLRNKSFINRGFINGPFCPIYGVGMNLIIIFLSEYKKNYILLVVMGMLLASVLEYITSFLLEKLFNDSWWDYSYRKFNINGRISLDISVAWGILSFIMIEFVVPVLDYLISKINLFFGCSFLFIFYVYFIADLTYTVYHIVSFSIVRDKFRQNRKELFEAVNSFREYIKSRLDAEEFKNKVDKKFDRLVNRYFDKYSLRNFKDEFSDMFKELSENNFEEYIDKYSLQKLIDEYKNEYTDLRDRRKKLVNRRIIRAYPNLHKKYRKKHNFLKEIKRYFIEKRENEDYKNEK